LFIAEGVLSYIPLPALAEVIKRLAAEFPGATLMGTYLESNRFMPAEDFWSELGVRPAWTMSSALELHDALPPLRLRQSWNLWRLLERYSSLTTTHPEADSNGLIFRATL
jgi:O-methyltransferase involved in polyketide biosynthesis